MINFPQIKNNILSIDYDYREPKTYVVFIPIVSLIVRKIQTSHLFDTIHVACQNPNQTFDLTQSREYTKLNSVYRWHTLGSLIQCIILCALSTLNPVFAVAALPSLYEAYTSIRAMGREVIEIKNGKLHLSR